MTTREGIQRAPARHEVKCWVQPFEDMKRGVKRADVRRCDDRDYRRGDELLERQFQATTGTFTGQALIARITHITKYAGVLELEGKINEPELGGEQRRPVAVLSVEVLEVGIYEALAATAVLR